MKTPKDWQDSFEYVEYQEPPTDKQLAFEEFVKTVQDDARQSQAETILGIVSAAGIDVSDCDGDDNPSVVLANWIVGRIEGLIENNRELEERLGNLVDQF